MTITVEKIGAASFKVTVKNGTVTTHTVTVAPDYWMKLTSGRISVEKLVEKSFEFLLERESNTSILRSFDLTVIQQYFSDYERVLTGSLH